MALELVNWDPLMRVANTLLLRLSTLKTAFRILNPQSRYGLSCAGALQEHEAKKPNLRGFEGLTKAETPILEACTRPGNKPKNPILGG